MNFRKICLTDQDVKQAVAHILEVNQGVVSLDIETMPRAGLEAYPTTLSGALGVKPTPLHYARWVYWTAAKYLNLPISVPEPPAKAFTKLQKTIWLDFLSKIEEIDLTQCATAEMPPYFLAYWTHALRWAAEQRPAKKDSVAPGLRPVDTDIFTLQLTTQDQNDNFVSYIIYFDNHPSCLLLPLLQDKQIEFVGQNIKFDLGHLIPHFTLANLPRHLYDTSVAHKLLQLGVVKTTSLKQLAFEYLGIELDKEVRSTFIGVRRDELTEAQIKYAFDDTELLFPIRTAQLLRAQSTHQTRLLYEFSKLSWITAFWETEGYVVDSAKWMELAQQSEAIRDEAAYELERMLLGAQYQEVFAVEATKAGEEVVEEEMDDEEDTDTRPTVALRLSQRTVVATLVKRLLGITDADIEEHKDFCSELTGEFSLGKDARSAIEHFVTTRDGEPHPFFAAYARWSAAAKMATTYGRKFLWSQHPITGRTYSTFRIAGTDTARYQSSGENMLNLPRGDLGVDVRSAFVAPEGYMIGGADFSSFEMRVAAAVSNDPGLVSIFEKNVDPHTGAAILSFHLERADVSAPTPIQRQMRLGANEYTMKVWQVPDHFDAEAYFSFALSELGMSALLIVDKDGKKDKPTRQSAKTVNFLVLFGGGASTLAAKTNITVEAATVIIDSHRKAFPALNEYIEQVGQMPFTSNRFTTKAGWECGYVQGAMGIRRYFRLPKRPNKVAPARFANLTEAQTYLENLEKSRVRPAFYPAEEWKSKAGAIETLADVYLPPTDTSHQLTDEAIMQTAKRLAYLEADWRFAEAKKQFNKSSSAIARQAFNLLPQGGNAVATAVAINTYIDRWYFSTGILPYLAVYDEIKVIVPLEYCMQFEGDERLIPPGYADLGNVMQQAAEGLFPNVPFEATPDPLSYNLKKQ